MSIAIAILACLVALGVAWWTGHPAGLHPPGDDPATNRVTRHSWYHLLGAALTTLAFGLVLGLAPGVAALIAAVAWAGVEVIQYRPRKPYITTRIVHGATVSTVSRTGTWEWLDLVFDALGAGVGWALLVLIGR